MTTKEEFIKYMTKQLIIVYTTWLNTNEGTQLPILQTIEDFMNSDLANIDDFVKVVADPEPYLILGASNDI